MAAGKRKHLVQYGKKRRRLPFASTSASSDDMSWFPSHDQIDYSQTPPALPPNKPTSQRAATMAVEPGDEMVSQLMDFTNLSRNQAVRYLKAKGNNLEAAAGAFFDGEDISKAEQATQWDEGVWSAGKEGTANNADQYLHPLASSAAATRPNSPAPSTGGRSNLHPTSKQEEDEDLARAMAMSTGELGAPYQQETGLIAADGQQTTFGPATREHYESSSWAMVPTGRHNTSEIVPDTDVVQRVNGAGEPRLLKYLPGGDYTPNLLTICSAINGAREALLMREHTQISYGQNGDWWRGEAITLPKIVNVDDPAAAQPDSDKHDELLAEVQRLMAFLSASARSYASVGGLMQKEISKEADPVQSTPSGTFLEYFLLQWAVGASSKPGAADQAAHLFSTRVGTNAAEGMRTPDMSLIDLQLNIPQDGKSDLSEQLDDLLWDTKVDTNEVSDNYIERPADVLVMRASQQNPTVNPQLRLEVPAEFYVDKYLHENIVATRTTRMQMADGRRRIAKIEEIEKKLKSWKHPRKDEHIDATLLLKHTLGHFSGQNRQDILNADKNSSVAEDMQPNPPQYDEIAKKLDKVITSIDNKLTVLAEEKEKTRKAVADMSRAPPPGMRPEDLKHRYTLRGVATKPNITYVLCPSDSTDGEQDLIDVDDESVPHGMRWWRMDYDVSGSKAKVTKTKSADYDVLRAVELEHSSALLVYANDSMNDAPANETLPGPLEEFVYRDNELLHAELHAQPTDPPAYDLTDVPRESVERTSMDSTRVEGGHSPPHYGDDDFMNHHSFGLGHEIKTGYRQDEHLDDDASVHEIRLDPPEDGGVEVEMVEKPRGSEFYTQSDTTMDGAS